MKKNILVIDDDPLALKMITVVLKEEGYATAEALNFEEALQKVRQTRPDLVVIDVVMPGITGFEACRKIKEMFKPHPPPVLLMTGNLKAVDPLYAIKMGADEFVAKTSDMAVLIQAVRKILS